MSYRRRTAVVAGLLAMAAATIAPSSPMRQQSPLASPELPPSWPARVATPAAGTRPTSGPSADDDRLTTSLSPQDAAAAIVLVFQNYRPFTLEAGYDGTGNSVDSQPQRQVKAGGYFFHADVSVTLDATDGASLRAACDWVRPGETTVRFTTAKLLPAADAMIRQQVTDALTTAAKRSAGR